MRYGGRAKGTKNKNRQTLLDKADALEVDPFQILLLFAKGDWEGLGYVSPTIIRHGRNGETYEVEVITADHRIKAASEASQYLHPKRRSVEGSLNLNHGADERPLKDLTDEELDELDHT